MSNSQNELKLKIDGMHCMMCVQRVTKALQSMPGVQLGAVEVGSASLEYNPTQTNVQQITAAIGKLGFSARADG